MQSTCVKLSTLRRDTWTRAKWNYGAVLYSIEAGQKTLSKRLVHSQQTFNEEEPRLKPLCRAMLTTDNPLTVVRVGSHNDPNQVKALQLEQEIKDVGVERPETAPGQIIDQKVNDSSYEVLAHLPKREALKRSVNRRRQAEIPQNPQSLEDVLQIPPEFQNTLAWEKFLLYDSLDDDNQELVY